MGMPREEETGKNGEVKLVRLSVAVHEALVRRKAAIEADTGKMLSLSKALGMILGITGGQDENGGGNESEN